jgi:serine/alanine adding enzyme
VAMLEDRVIQTFDPLNDDRWDTLTALHPRASFFHSSKWARVLRKSYGHRLHYLGQLNAGKPGSLLPILEVNSPWKGRRGVTLPFSDECGLLCFDDEDGRDLIAHALELGRERGLRSSCQLVSISG